MHTHNKQDFLSKQLNITAYMSRQNEINKKILRAKVFYEHIRKLILGDNPWTQT